METRVNNTNTFGSSSGIEGRALSKNMLITALIISATVFVILGAIGTTGILHSKGLLDLTHTFSWIASAGHIGHITMLAGAGLSLVLFGISIVKLCQRQRAGENNHSTISSQGLHAHQPSEGSFSVEPSSFDAAEPHLEENHPGGSPEPHAEIFEEVVVVAAPHPIAHPPSPTANMASASAAAASNHAPEEHLMAQPLIPIADGAIAAAGAEGDPTVLGASGGSEGAIGGGEESSEDEVFEDIPDTFLQSAGHGAAAAAPEEGHLGMATSTIGKTYTILNTVHLGDQGVFSSLPTLHYLGSVAGNIGRVLTGRRQEAFRGFGLHTCYYALEEQERTGIEGKIMYLSDAGTRAPIEKNYCERWRENPSALTQSINTMKAEMRQPQGKNLFYLPMATLIGSELHVVALVVDTKDRQLFFLDSKGYRPSDLFVTQSGNKESSDLSCETVIQQVVAEGELEGYTLFITPNFQKVRDCAICVTVMVSMMARQRLAQPDQKLDLKAIFEDLYANYARVDEIRAKCLATK